MPVPPIHDFFLELDRAWKMTGTRTIRLPIIGAGALLLQTAYARLTKDSDVLETADIDEGVRSQFEHLAGKQSRLSLRHKIYLDIVAPGLPLLPQRPNWVAIPELTDRLLHFRIEALHLVDVVVSKLKRFHANDRHDIEAMVHRGLVPHDQMIERFRSAIDAFSLDARAAELPRCLDNLHLVERDFFDTDETKIDLPPCIDY
jgi:hypothetical protein